MYPRRRLDAFGFVDQAVPTAAAVLLFAVPFRFQVHPRGARDRLRPPVRLIVVVGRTALGSGPGMMGQDRHRSFRAALTTKRRPS
ncbi:hypothetical protein [Streptomyces sp. NPDC058739]|uniref:hypothetical protein n=1 Tax=Streptomyces sp. NPDC058739 TaxID=3346618 RepID=UPI0036AFFF90